LPWEPGEELLPPPEKKEELTCSVFSGRIIRDWRIASFSSLASGRKKEAEAPDHGVMEAPDQTRDFAAEPFPSFRRNLGDIRLLKERELTPDPRNLEL
jgi:hypothetical protein